MKLRTSLMLVTAAMTLSACSGGGGGGGGKPYDVAAHDALAQQFIQEATAEGLHITLAKQDTKSQGYIVVKGADGIYTAYDVDKYVPGQNALSFMISQCSNQDCYTGLGLNVGNVYTGTVQTFESSGYYTYDYYGNYVYVDTSHWVTTNVAFEATQPSSKDLQKLAAFSQQYEIDAGAQKVAQKYGLSLERSTIVAKLAVEMKNKTNLTEADRNDITQQVLGFDLPSLDKAVASSQAGDTSLQDNLIAAAAQTNGIGTEQARSLLNGLISSAK